MKILYTFIIVCAMWSCKTSYSFELEPRKQGAIVFDGEVLINRIQSEVPLEKEEKLVKSMLKQLTGIKPGVHYIGQVNMDGRIPEPIDYVPQPEILMRLHEEFGYAYLINFQTSVNQRKEGGFALGEQDLEHHAMAEVTVFETLSHRMVYRQQVFLHEEWDYTMDDDLEEKPRFFLITRSSENLMEIGIRKCARQLKRSTK